MQHLAPLVFAVAAILLQVAMADAHNDERPYGVEGNWELVFSDEFNDRDLDRSKWTTCYWWDDNGCTNLGNNELQWYLPSNVFQAGGSLNLIARADSVRGYRGRAFNYTSGIVTTGRYYRESSSRTRFAATYGFFEIRAKVPKGRGLWSAFWLLPATLKPRPEIDVMEIIGHRTDVLEMHFHYLNAAGAHRSRGHNVRTTDLSAGWHVYAVHWSPEAIVWYLDGVERWRVTDQSVIPREPMYMLINLAVGGDWPGPPDRNTQFPSLLRVDYVRAWKEIPG
jgi:beta-glucanase (GH16 family)